MAFLFLNTEANGMSEHSGSDEKWIKGKKRMGLKFVGKVFETARGRENKLEGREGKEEWLKG